MRKPFAKLAVGIAAASLMLTFTACADDPGTSGSAGSGSNKIGAAFPILDEFLQTVATAAEEKGKELGYEVEVVSAEEKTDKQLSQIENFIANGYAAIIVIPQDTDAVGPIITKAKEANIPLVFVNRNPADRPVDTPYVGSDSKNSGLLEMTELAKLAGGKGNVAILEGDPSQEAARLRTEACEEVVAENPGMKVVKTQAGNWYREKGLSITENWLQSGEQIDVICANNDEMALGAIQALKAADKLSDVLVGGVDATKDGLAAMESGELAVTVYQNGKGQGEGGVTAADALIKGQAVPGADDTGYVDIPYEVVTKDNFEEMKQKILG
ncbi:MAG: sugar ABC transporter substrate-binding protein [Propionibacteriaceae bacterium]|jgi:inositol transport system substrate-binding protein|nr:sugar ABC transporter substrate-binding protein [Propionibacteriaceae bacterium]